MTTENFAVLSGSGITNTGATTITGDIGSSPTSTETGFGSVTIINGVNHTSADPNDAVTVTAKTDLVTAYNDASGRPTTATVATELGGSTLTDGVYDSASGTFGITGTLTLDAQGNSDAVFIFKTSTGTPSSGSTFITAGSSKVVLINGAQACNVFWQVSSSATLGTSTSLAGTILALTSITDDGSSTINGRLLARNGAVTLNNTTIAKSTCAATTSSNSSSPSSSLPSASICIDTAPSNSPDLFQIDRAGSKATLFFTPVNDHLSYYYVAYGLTPVDERFGVTFQAVLSSGVVNYTIIDLNPNTTYYFKVRGGSGCAPGGWSNNKESNSKNPMLPNTGHGSSEDLIHTIQRWFSNL
ncbi:MAG: DUF3494 domain-containing protein [Oligoflexia bacterium]|nr:DUF3494 domain-containing protein [Oligoflexia bacterium]